MMKGLVSGPNGGRKHYSILNEWNELLVSNSVAYVSTLELGSFSDYGGLINIISCLIFPTHTSSQCYCTGN